MNSKFDKILQPVKYHKLKLKNKIFMSSMNRCRADKSTGSVTEMMETYYLQRTSAGIIFTEPIYVSKSGVTSLGSSYWTSEGMEGWKRLVGKVHEVGGVIFATLSHGGRVSHPEVNGGEIPIAPSALTPNIQILKEDRILSPVQPREMSEEDINFVLDDFHKAAMGVKEAGFDGISLHGTSGCLVESFIKSGTNLRSDRWGGNGGLLFPVEILKRFRNEFAQEYTTIKINPYDNYHDMHENQPYEKYRDLIKNIMRFSPIGLIELKQAYEKGSDFKSSQKNNKVIIEENAKLAKLIKTYNECKLISNFGTKNMNDGLRQIEDGDCDFLSCATFYVSNPNISDKLERGLPLKLPDKNLYYSDGIKGYIDY